VDTLQDGVLYNESMGLRYSTPDQGRWLADTGFTNQSFAEYLNHGGGRGPQNSYQAMLRNFPTGGGAPAFLGPEPPATPGRWLEEELGLHRHRPGGRDHDDGRTAHHTTDLAIDRLVPKDASVGELAVEVTRERFDRPGVDPGDAAAAAGGTADGGRFTSRARPRPESRSLASSSAEAGRITDLGPHQAPPEGRAPASPDPAVRSGGSGVDPVAVNVIPRRPEPGRSALVRRVV
jgi:hypothetical protein